MAVLLFENQNCNLEASLISVTLFARVANLPQMDTYVTVVLFLQLDIAYAGVKSDLTVGASTTSR